MNIEGRPGHVDMARLAILIRSPPNAAPASCRRSTRSRRRRAGRPCTSDPGRRHARPIGIVALLQQAAAVDRHQARELRMHARTMQALVVVLPEYFPVAGSSSRSTCPTTSSSSGHASSRFERHVEQPIEGGRVLRQRDEHEPAPFRTLTCRAGNPPSRSRRRVLLEEVRNKSPCRL